jgi:hypothetical protein
MGMTRDEESALLIKIDKNLDVLINDVNREVKSNDEFKIEIKKTIDSTQVRLREIEIWKSKTEVAQEDGKFIKQTIIRWVIANMLTSVVSVAGIVYLLSKGL